jgi:hypothetical protein
MPDLLSVGYMASVQGGGFFKLVVDELKNKQYDPNNSAWRVVGNQHLSDVYAKYRHVYGKLQVYPSHYFIPEHHSGQKYYGNGPVYARQHWGSTHGSELYGSE